MSRDRLFKTTLRPGRSTASLQSLSSGLAGEAPFTPRFWTGARRLPALGLDYVVSPNALKGAPLLSARPELRAADLMAALKDERVDLIIAALGGLDSHRLIPFLEASVLAKHPKPILGYSDITSLHLYFYQHGVQTYYGPAVLDGLAENGAMHALTQDSLKRVLFTNAPQVLRSSATWTSEFLDWANPAFNNQLRALTREAHGLVWVNFKRPVTGFLLGGCLDTIVNIKDAPFFPPLSAWQGAVIFLETSEQKMTPPAFAAALHGLAAHINVAAAIIFGKPKDETFFAEYLAIAKAHITKPFVFNVNFGHTAPLYTLPYGGTAVLDHVKKTITVTK